MRRSRDRDALLTFALSNLLFLASGGLWLVFLLYKVVETVRHAPTLPAADSHILVFGHRLSPSGELSANYRQRLDRAAHCLQQYSGVTVLLLGGITRCGAPSEAASGKLYLCRMGNGAERIYTEDRSQHTLDNLRQALPLLMVERERPLVLLSNRYHLARTLAFARRMGLDARVCAAEDRRPLDPRACCEYLREAYYLHWYMTGERWARLTGNQRTLARLR
jgi:uncharacterized SAM-binding protein YcdF (DUF218 family)